MATIYQILSRYKNKLSENRDQVRHGDEARYNLEQNELYIYFRDLAYSSHKNNKKKSSFLDKLLSLKDSLENENHADYALFQLISDALSNKNGTDTRLCNNIIVGTQYVSTNRKYTELAKRTLYPNALSDKVTTLKSFLKHYNNDSCTAEFQSIAASILKNTSIYAGIIAVAESAAIITSIEEKANYYKRKKITGEKDSISFTEVSLNNIVSSEETSTNNTNITYSRFNPDLGEDDLSNLEFISNCIKLMVSLYQSHLNSSNLNRLFIPLSIDQISGAGIYLLGKERIKHGEPVGIINIRQFRIFKEEGTKAKYSGAFFPYSTFEDYGSYDDLIESFLSSPHSDDSFYTFDENDDSLGSTLLDDFTAFGHNVIYHRERLKHSNAQAQLTDIPQDFKCFFPDTTATRKSCLPPDVKLQNADKQRVNEVIQKEMDMLSDR